MNVAKMKIGENIILVHTF